MILGVDPGTSESAFCLYDDLGQVPIDKGKVPNLELARMIETAEYGVLAVEVMQSYGMPVGSEVFDTLIWIGRFREIAVTSSPDSLMWPCLRKRIVMHHCGSMKATDKQIRERMIERFGQPGTLKEPGPTYGFARDMWSALAIASYASDMRQLGNNPIPFPAFL